MPTCISQCLYFIGYLPVILVLSIQCILFFTNLKSGQSGLLFLSITLVRPLKLTRTVMINLTTCTLYVFSVWSFLQVVRTDPGHPHSDLDQHSSLETKRNGQVLSFLSLNAQPRFCHKCACHKPDRTHHCSACNRCILKMDHHCPWVNNCIGFYNYKYFCLFIGYNLGYSLWVFAIALHDLQSMDLVWIFQSYFVDTHWGPI